MVTARVVSTAIESGVGGAETLNCMRSDHGKRDMAMVGMTANHSGRIRSGATYEVVSQTRRHHCVTHRDRAYR